MAQKHFNDGIFFLDRMTKEELKKRLQEAITERNDAQAIIDGIKRRLAEKE